MNAFGVLVKWAGKTQKQYIIGLYIEVYRNMIREGRRKNIHVLDE